MLFSASDSISNQLLKHLPLKLSSTGCPLKAGLFHHVPLHWTALPLSVHLSQNLRGRHVHSHLTCMPCSLLPNSLPNLSNALLPKSTLGFTCQPPFSHSLDGCSPSHWLLPKAPAPPLCSAETEIRLCCLPVKMTEHTPDNAAHSTACAGPSSLFSGHSLHPDDFLASFQTLVLTYSILLAAFTSPFFPPTGHSFCPHPFT